MRLSQKVVEKRLFRASPFFYPNFWLFMDTTDFLRADFLPHLAYFLVLFRVGFPLFQIMGNTKKTQIRCIFREAP
jgi:hypothetical protein